MDKQIIITAIERQRKEAQVVIERFTRKLVEHPREAFEWSDDAFRAAAILDVFGYVLQVLTNPDSKATVETCLAYADREVIMGAKHGSSSTSQPSNLIKQYRLAAWAEMLEILRCL